MLKCANELENIQMLFSNNDILHKCVVKYYENGDKNVSKLKSGVWLYYIITKILGRQIREELTEAEAAAVTTATTSVPKNSYQWIINDIY